MTECATCYAPLALKPGGWARRYCSTACKREAEATRAAMKRTGPAASIDMATAVYERDVTRVARQLGVRECDLAYTIAYRAATRVRLGLPERAA